MQLNQNLLNKRERYYSKIYVLFELLKPMRNREVVFMSKSNNAHCIRGFFFKNIDIIKYAFDKFDFFNKDYNIYISTAQYHTIPTFTYKLKERSGETKKWFDNEGHNQMFNYDLLLDFDRTKKITEKEFNMIDSQKKWKSGEEFYIEDYVGMFTEVKIMLLTLDQNRIKYYIVPSGKNFQIVIPGDIIPFKKKFNKDVKQYSFNRKVAEVVKNISHIFKFKHLDLKNNGVYNRIMKCPYSLVGNRVVLPINSIDFFSYDSVDINEVLKNVYLYKRGLKTKCGHISTYDLQKNFNKFAKKFCLI